MPYVTQETNIHCRMCTKAIVALLEPDLLTVTIPQEPGTLSNRETVIYLSESLARIIRDGLNDVLEPASQAETREAESKDRTSILPPCPACGQDVCDDVLGGYCSNVCALANGERIGQ